MPEVACDVCKSNAILVQALGIRLPVVQYNLLHLRFRRVTPGLCITMLRRLAASSSLALPAPDARVRVDNCVRSGEVYEDMKAAHLAKRRRRGRTD